MSDTGYPVRTTATRYEVSLLPQDYRDGYLWTVKVEYRGRGLWAVLWNSECLSKSGEWDYESIPSERGDEWLADHRYPLTEALVLAEQWAPRVAIFSHRDQKMMSAMDVLDKYPDEIYGKGDW